MKNWGGKRPGAGAHKKADKKVQINIYVLESQIEALSKERIREICKEKIEIEYFKTIAL